MELHFRINTQGPITKNDSNWKNIGLDLSLDKDISQVEKIQRSAARFVKNDYGRYSSVTEMMKELHSGNLFIQGGERID